MSVDKSRPFIGSFVISSRHAGEYNIMIARMIKIEAKYAVSVTLCTSGINIPFICSSSRGRYAIESDKTVQACPRARSGS